MKEISDYNEILYRFKPYLKFWISARHPYGIDVDRNYLNSYQTTLTNEHTTIKDLTENGYTSNGTTNIIKGTVNYNTFNYPTPVTNDEFVFDKTNNIITSSTFTTQFSAVVIRKRLEPISTTSFLGRWFTVNTGNGVFFDLTNTKYDAWLSSNIFGVDNNQVTTDEKTELIYFTFNGSKKSMWATRLNTSTNKIETVNIFTDLTGGDNTIGGNKFVIGLPTQYPTQAGAFNVSEVLIFNASLSESARNLIRDILLKYYKLT
jgi:hypothetical protein